VQEATAALQLGLLLIGGSDALFTLHNWYYHTSVYSSVMHLQHGALLSTLSQSFRLDLAASLWVAGPHGHVSPDSKTAR